MDTRFDGLRPAPCLALLMTLILVLIGSLTLAAMPQSEASAPGRAPGRITDSQLYQRIIDRVSSGESYHAAAVTEHRDYDYPLKPFVTVRMPALAWTNAWLGPAHTQHLMLALIALVTLSWLTALRPLSDAPATPCDQLCADRLQRHADVAGGASRLP